MSKWVTLLLCTLLAMTSIAAVSLSAFAEDGRILDGRWLCSNIAGNVTEDTPTELKDESLTGHDAELVHKLYAMTGDWEYRNAQGLSPALPYLQAIAGIDSLDALLKYLCSEDRLTSTVPFNAHIAPDETSLAIYTVYVEPLGLMLEDPEEYVERTEYGEEANWWTDEDYAAFQSRAEKLADWYDGFIPYDGIQYSGQQVKREAIADLGSMKCMLSIAAQKENFDYDAFFRQWARVQREKSAPEMVREEALYDSHPLGYMRINATLAQFEEFVDFYGIKEGDGMYIAPKDRLEIW